MQLSKDQLKLREHASQYYNPTGNVINVEPMGIVDENGLVMKTLPPGGIIMIPYSCQLGQRRSVVKSCCPQLQPVPKLQLVENLLDASPTSYVEWLAYYPPTATKCCGMSVVWSYAYQAPFCLDCRKPVVMSDYWSNK